MKWVSNEKKFAKPVVDQVFAWWPVYSKWDKETVWLERVWRKRVWFIFGVQTNYYVSEQSINDSMKMSFVREFFGDGSGGLS